MRYAASGQYHINRRRSRVTQSHEQESRDTLPASAILAPIRDFFAQHEQLQVLWELFSLDVVVDANVIIQDIRWTVLKRRNPLAFPALREAIEAGTVRAIAPPELEEEVVYHLRRIASEECRDPQEFLDEWVRYKQSIRIMEARGELTLTHLQDPDDAPYLKLQLQTGAVIRSDDTDLSGMGGRVVGAEVMVKLRDYSQDAAYVFSFRFGAVVLSEVTVGLIQSLWDLLKRGWEALGRLPPGLLALLLGFVFAVLVHPVTRRLIESSMQKAGQALQPIFDGMLSVTADVHAEYRRRVDRGEVALNAARAQIPKNL